MGRVVVIYNRKEGKIRGTKNRSEVVRKKKKKKALDKSRPECYNGFKVRNTKYLPKQIDQYHIRYKERWLLWQDREW